MSGRVIHVQEVSTGAAKQRVSRLEEETIDRARCVHVPVLLGASGVGYPGGRGRGRRLAPVRGSSAALARDRRRPLPHGSPADAAGPPADTYRIRLSKEQRRLAQAVCSSPVPLMPLRTESRCPHGASLRSSTNPHLGREAPRISSTQPSALPTWHTAVAPSPNRNLLARYERLIAVVLWSAGGPGRRCASLGIRPGSPRAGDLGRRAAQPCTPVAAGAGHARWPLAGAVGPRGFPDAVGVGDQPGAQQVS